MFEPVRENVYKPKIAVIGVGGAGCNAINHMIENGLTDVRFFAVNTDLQALERSKAEHKIQIGPNLTRGLGSGGDPEIGRKAAEESIDQIKDILAELDMIFIAAGEGGGTGTGASPVIAEVAKTLGILTVAVVTKPFSIEGSIRRRNAEAGINELRDYVDTLIVIPNDKILSVAPKGTPVKMAFKIADDILCNATKAIADLITKPGIINLDFADVKSVMAYRGNAIIGIGMAKGDTRAKDAAEKAISSPLIEDFDITGAKGVLINISGGEDLALDEAIDAAKIIQQSVSRDALILYGISEDNFSDGEIRVTVIATGIEEVSKKPPSNIETLMPGGDSFEIPAFMRMKKSFEAKRKFDENDLDIPTFLRKQSEE